MKLPADVLSRLPILMQGSASRDLPTEKKYTPIRQKYDGYYFRSRLEARWAVFFNELGVKYEYEKQVYTLDGGVKYLPDFFLPKYNLFIEIKGKEPEMEEEIKCRDLFTLTKCAVAICHGLPEYDGLYRASMLCWGKVSENGTEVFEVFDLDFHFSNDNDGTLGFCFDFDFPEVRDNVPFCDQDIFWPRFYASPNLCYELPQSGNWDAIGDAVEIAKFPQDHGLW